MAVCCVQFGNGVKLVISYAIINYIWCIVSRNEPVTITKKTT